MNSNLIDNSSSHRTFDHGNYGWYPIFPLVAIMIAISLLLTSCAPKSDSDVIQDSIIEKMNSFKYRDHNTMEKFIEYMDIEQLSIFNIDPFEFTDAFFDGFDYSINGITIEEGKAIAELQITCKNFSGFLDTLAEYSEDISGKISKDASLSTDLRKAYGSEIMDILKDTDTKSSRVAEVLYNLDGNAYKIETDLFYTTVDLLINE